MTAPYELFPAAGTARRLKQANSLVAQHSVGSLSGLLDPGKELVVGGGRDESLKGVRSAYAAEAIGIIEYDCDDNCSLNKYDPSEKNANTFFSLFGNREPNWLFLEEAHCKT